MENLLLKMKVYTYGLKALGGRRWYQYIEFNPSLSNIFFTGERGKIRTQLFIDFLNKFPFTKDDKILDIGSNAGLFCLHCSSKVNHVIGVEFDPGFHKQAQFVKEYHQKKLGKKFDNVELISGSILDHLDKIKDRTIIFASKVLYHKNLGSGLADLLKAIKNSNVHTILLQGHTTQGEIGQEEGMKKLMDSIGFDYDLIFPHHEYPVSIAKRRKS